MMRDRVVVAVVPIPDRCEHPVGVEVERVATAAEFRRQKGDPFAEAATADIGFGIDEFTADRVTLCRRDHRVAEALRAAGCRGAKCAEGTALHDVVAERRGFAGDRRAGRDFQPAAPGDSAWHVLLRRRCLGPDGEGVGLLLAQIVLEFFVVGFCDRVPAGDEGID